MGQHVSLPLAQAGPTGINVRELSDLSYERSLGTARFMKSMRTRHKHGLVVVRLFGRPHERFDFAPYVQKIKRERELLGGVANALAYVRVVETPHAGYLCRQYLASSLYDRISTRPFLEDIEKKWIAFQLLTAIRDCHNLDVYHGDIKTENVLVTSWNWLYLADFSSSFKPTYVPEDDPADYSYYFDTSGRRTCYLAPERFLRPGQRADEQGVTWAMDVFSAGCVIAELFLEAPFLTLSSSIRYRDGDSISVDNALKRIEDVEIRELVAHMTQIEPESRYSAEEYLNFWRRKAFPEYFYSFLHQYLELLTDPSGGRNPVDPKEQNFGNADDRIHRVYLDFEKITYFLDLSDEDSQTRQPSSKQSHSRNILPVQLDIPNQRHAVQRTERTNKGSDDGSLIFLTLVVASIRNTARSSARVQACDIMLAFAERLSDTAKLDRVLPFLVALLDDPCDVVKMAAVRSVVQLLDLVEVASPINAYVFTEYVKPRLQSMVYDSKSKTGPAVRATYAACLASLARSSMRILDMAQSLQTDGLSAHISRDAEERKGMGESQRALYDGARSDLIEHFVNHTKALLTDPEASVRRAFLGSVSSLCVFFGPARAADVVVSHLNTYLNDRDWMLKCAFFHTIVGVATYIGSTAFEDFILPLMLQAMTDPEEFVVEKVISSFASMAALGLFKRARLIEMVDIVARFTMHPNRWIREAATHFISASSGHLQAADVHGLLLPMLQPYLKIHATELGEPVLLDALKKPISRAVLEMAANWSQKVDKGIFWKPQRDQHTFTFRSPDNSVAAISSRDLSSKALHRLPKNQEDEQWLARLGNLGMNDSEDGFKLLALREYILRMARRRGEKRNDAAKQNLNSQVDLLPLGIMPEKILFEKQTRVVVQDKEILDKTAISSRKRGHTITDALLDASQSLDENLDMRSPSQVGSDHISAADVHPRPSSHRTISDSTLSMAGRTEFAVDRPARPSLLVTDLEGRRHSTTTISDDGRVKTNLDRVKNLRHRSSAVNLLGKRGISPASFGTAQISTSTTHAEGEMDGLFHADTTEDNASAPQKDGNISTAKYPRKEDFVSHTYHGTDPNVTKLLDNLAAHSAIYDDAEFGPHVAIKARRHGPKVEGQKPDAPYRPSGVLVATITEQSDSIKQLLPSPDHNFFLSASDDGSIAIYDRQRFEKSLVHRPRLLHRHGDDTQIAAICFVQNTHSFVSCATDGSVHVVKVECSWAGKTLRIGNLAVKRSYQLRRGEYAVWCEHFRSTKNMQSVLILVTSIGRVVALDLRSLSTLYSFDVPKPYGTPTTACLGSSKTWILLGTSAGLLVLYDLRFHLIVRVWGISGAFPINKIELYERSRYQNTSLSSENQVPLVDDRTDRTVAVVGGSGSNDVSVWDIEKCTCIELFRVDPEGFEVVKTEKSSAKGGMPFNLATNKDIHRSIEPVSIKELKPHELLSSLDGSSAAEAGSDQSPRSLCVGTLHSYRHHAVAGNDRSGHAGQVSNNIQQPSPTTSFVVAAGADRKVRFWAPKSLGSSAVVSGLSADEAQPKYRSVQSALSPGLVIHAEVADSRPEAAKADERRRMGRTLVMQREQNALLRQHLDVVTAVMVLEGNEARYIISGDRNGTILVFR